MKTARSIVSGPWPRLQRAWDLRAACNFIGGGTGTGLLAVALVSGLSGHDWLIPAFLGLAFIGFGLLMVFLEIGKPWRAFNVFLHPQTSWMTREGVVALPLFACGGGALGLGLLGMQGAGLALLAVTTACAAAFLYCQARILRAARGIPSWRDKALTPYILVSGPAEGAGIFAVQAHFTGAPGWLLLLTVLLVALRAVAWWHFRRALGRRGAPADSLAALDRLAPAFFALGHGVAGLLLAGAWLGLPAAGWLTAAGGLLVAVSGWQAKRVLITRAAQTQGFAIPRTPVRGRGPSHDGATPGWVGG